MPPQSQLHRRRLLQFLAASPLLQTDLVLAQLAEDEDYLAPTPSRVANVFDMEKVARSQWNAGHLTYIAQGVDDELTLRANREAFSELHLKPRRLVDVSSVDTRLSLFGESLHSPILLAPVGGMGMAHPEGEVAAARGARESGHQMILSTAATFGFDTVVPARGAPIWYQLYPTDHWEVTQALLRQAEQHGCRVVFLTVDIPARNQDRMRRFDRSAPDCASCHASHPGFGQKPMMRDIDLPPGTNLTHPGMDWDFVKRLKDSTAMQVVIKGLTLAEDARLAVESGVDGILVSNHGGRADESGYATIRALPEVVAAVEGRIPVLMDGGIRRGTDIVKALALGATAVCVGRPYVWGLGAFGAEGVAEVMRILDRELEIAMKQCGSTSLAALHPGVLRNPPQV